ncbi:3127_t:CDS:10 [Acaulospora colombiana]|uniref:3127_t:CDS:1 n=1 Tax=Acaulospora colombiana TaxID=27376 RepID=A0ACA9KIY0_9GLOM|nr:3127_t:CDS:10 [Acaulospora colombiana]
MVTDNLISLDYLLQQFISQIFGKSVLQLALKKRALDQTNFLISYFTLIRSQQSLQNVGSTWIKGFPQMFVNEKSSKLRDTDVSLQIIKALLDKCNNNLNLFSKNVLKIISASLSTNDIDVIARAASFITFCSYHDGSTLGVDIEFTEIYENLISSFAHYATFKDQDIKIERRYRSIGLHAIQAVITSNALYATNAKKQLQYIVPAVLHSLTDDLEDMQKADFNLNNGEAIPQPRRFSVSVTAISLEDNINLAHHCLKELFKTTSPSNVHYSLEPVFKFLDENEMWSPSSFGVSLILTILSSLQQQCRHILVSDIMQQLEALPEGSIPMQKKLTLVEVLSSILTSKFTLVGLSILEVLEVLLHLLLNSLKSGEGDTDKSQELISQKLISCIDSSQQGGGSNDSSISEGIPLADLRKALLKCLDMVVQTNKKVDLKIKKYETPVEIFHDTISLCMDEDLDVRITYAKVLSTFLSNIDVSVESKDTDSTKLTYFNQPAIHFLNTLHLSLYQYALSESAQPADHVAAKEENLEGFARQRALASVIALYFRDIAAVLDIRELREYVEKIQSERIAKCQWSSFIKVTSSENDLDDTNLFKPFEDEVFNEDNRPLQPTDIWLDRQVIVSMLCQHKEMSGVGREKLEVELMAEWKPEEGFENVKKEGHRIRSSRIMENDKPRIAITSFVMNLEDSSGELPKIKVENLRDALVQPTINDSSEQDTSAASDMESINMVPLGNKKRRKSKPKTDINAFLQTIDTKASASIDHL